jgi:hypothetical protein
MTSKATVTRDEDRERLALSTDTVGPPSLRWMLRRARYVLRTEGLRSVTRKALARSLYGGVILLELDLAAWVREVSTTIPLDVQELDLEYASAYLRARPDLGEAEMRRRLANGDRCYVTWTGDRITSAVWFGTGRMWIPEIASYMDLEPRQVYGYDSWTAPDLRGRNIAAARGVTTCATLRDAGFRSMVAYVLAGNNSGIRPLAKLGFQRAAVLRSVRLGFFRLDFASTDGRRTQWGLRRCRYARSKLRNARPESEQIAGNR